MWTYIAFEVTLEATNKSMATIPYCNHIFNSDKDPAVTTYLNRSNDLLQYLFHLDGIPYSPKVLHTQNMNYDLLSSKSGTIVAKTGGPSDYILKYKRLELR